MITTKYIPKGCFFTAQDLAYGYNNIKKLKVSGINRALCENVIRDFFGLMIDDVVNQDTVFKFSTRFPATILTELIDKDEFIRLRQLGRFYEINPLLSNFSGYDVKLIYKASDHRTVKYNIILDHRLKLTLIDRANGRVSSEKKDKDEL